MTNREFEKYFKKASSPISVWEPHVPSGEYKCMIVIPVLGEFETLPALLTSIKLHDAAICLVINQQAESKEEYKIQNNQLLEWLKISKIPNIFWLDFTENYLSPPGVGAARKRGMDAALQAIATPSNCGNKILLSLDGDTMVEENYLQAVFSAFNKHPDWCGATIDFEHIAKDSATMRAIVIYEKYLRNYRDKLAAANSPYAYIPLGSAMAVRGDAYIRAGGMRTRAGGEDFYFLQALRKIGVIGEIIETKVHPSARPSDRVPFGTGPRVKKIMEDGDIEFEPDWIFNEVKKLLELVNSAPNIEFMLNLSSAIPSRVAPFFNELNFSENWHKITKNTPHTPDALRHAFMVWFDAFRTLKLIHFLGKHDPTATS